MIKKVRMPSQSKIRTSAQATRSTKPSGMSRKRKPAPKAPEEEMPKDEIINLDDIILE